MVEFENSCGQVPGAKGCAQRLWYPCQVSNTILCICCFGMEVAKCQGLCPVAVVGGGSGGIGDEMSARQWCSLSPCDSKGGSSSSTSAASSGLKSVAKVLCLGLW